MANSVQFEPKFYSVNLTFEKVDLVVHSPNPVEDWHIVWTDPPGSFRVEREESYSEGEW